MIFFIQAAKSVPGRNWSNDAYARVRLLDQVFSVCCVAGHAPGGGVEGAAMREGFLLESRTALSEAGMPLAQRPSGPGSSDSPLLPSCRRPGHY